MNLGGFGGSVRGFLAVFLFKTNTANEDKFASSPVSIMA